MTTTQNRPKPATRKSSLIFQRYKQAERAEEEKRKADAIEMMIEAKVNMALRQLVR